MTCGGSGQVQPGCRGLPQFRHLVNGFPRREAMAFVNQTLNKEWKAQGYVLKGFTNGSPNIGAGLHAPSLRMGTFDINMPRLAA